MILPSARAAIVAAAAAPLALVIAASAPALWVLAPAMAAALLALVLADAALAGPLHDLRVLAPTDAEVGQPFTVTVLADMARPVRAEAALGCDARLGTAGRAEAQLQFEEVSAVHEGDLILRSDRRGTAAIERVWLRWTGPLGLGYRQASRELDLAVRIWPDLSPVRSPTLQAYLRDAQLGLLARRIRGEGHEFETLVEYAPGMDRRRIDWKSSARHARLFARESESERNNQIVLAFDCGQSMCEPVDGLPRIDRAVSAGLTAAYVALKGGDRVSLFGFAARPQVASPFVSEARAFHRLQTAAAALDYHAQEPNFTLALATLTTRLARRSLVILFSDFTDPTSAELMIESVGRLIKHHLVIFVTMEDTELAAIAGAPPDDVKALAMAVSADTLARQRALVLLRLRQLGVDVIEAPWQQIGYRLIDRYLAIKAREAIG